MPCSEQHSRDHLGTRPGTDAPSASRQMGSLPGPSPPNRFWEGNDFSHPMFLRVLDCFSNQKGKRATSSLTARSGSQQMQFIWQTASRRTSAWRHCDPSPHASRRFPPPSITTCRRGDGRLAQVVGSKVAKSFWSSAAAPFLLSFLHRAAPCRARTNGDPTTRH